MCLMHTCQGCYICLALAGLGGVKESPVRSGTTFFTALAFVRDGFKQMGDSSSQLCEQVTVCEVTQARLKGGEHSALPTRIGLV